MQAFLYGFIDNIILLILLKRDIILIVEKNIKAYNDNDFKFANYIFSKPISKINIVNLDSNGVNILKDSVFNTI